MGICITIGREFGSGGREVGKRLADELNFAYYDTEIIKNIAKESGYAEGIVEKYSESKVTRQFPITFGRTFSYAPMTNLNDEIFLHKRKILEQFAESGDCVIVGRCADQVLKKQNPFKVFVHSSDMDKRIDRCYDKVPEDKKLSRKDIEKHIKMIDKGRADYYQYYTDEKWANMKNYNLSVDTGIFDTKQAVAIICTAVKSKYELD